VAAFLLVVGVSQSAFGQTVSVELSLERNEFRQGTAVSLKYTVTNTESRPVAVLKWNTPLEGDLVGNPFVILQNGAERRFSGVMAMRFNPVASDWTLIPAKGSVSATVDLASAYDLTAAGDYQVRLRHGFHHVAFDAIPRLKRKALRSRDVRSNTVTFRMLDAGTPATLPAPPKPSASMGEPPSISSFVGCSTDQQNSLGVAYAALGPAALKVSSTVAAWNCTSWGQSNAATTFLGTCTPEGLQLVQRVTSTITTRSQGTVVLDCTGTNTCSPSKRSNCTNPSAGAFTCGNGTNTIYVCPNVFFGLPQTGALDSQETVIYHEMSHWAGTSDKDYDCQSCVNTASSNPMQAQNNASNYMYFAIFQATGDSPSCGVEHLAAFAGLLVLLVQLTGRTIVRRKALARVQAGR
jgi:peptidyl-Lys metalloendopeptidase